MEPMRSRTVDSERPTAFARSATVIRALDCRSCRMRMLVSSMRVIGGLPRGDTGRARAAPSRLGPWPFRVVGRVVAQRDAVAGVDAVQGQGRLDRGLGLGLGLAVHEDVAGAAVAQAG